MFARSIPSLAALAGVVALAAACSPAVDIKQALEISEASGGWYDAGIVEGKNKIVPTVTFRIRKKGDVDIDSVAVNVAFRYPPAAGATTEDELDEVFLQTARFSEGTQTPPITVKTPTGYTGDPPQGRLDLLKHSQFRDVRARVYVKYGSTQWVDIGTIDVPRTLITK
jgi:hypothetical protein